MIVRCQVHKGIPIRWGFMEVGNITRKENLTTMKLKKTLQASEATFPQKRFYGLFVCALG